MLVHFVIVINKDERWPKTGHDLLEKSQQFTKGSDQRQTPPHTDTLTQIKTNNSWSEVF